ncbi:helix-turn-helix domain-containing protein [Actinoplanes sp. NBRC 103695]|uniref:helix-turn-helix domain-containing protein n=1 Tax=Actinoplanes sp. NBRC 103695 TaxID=3032202 RepID=UPI0024A3FFBB|nr:helix-turn-helix domain-containing protein [Actinoplanes sp. NBRC 103695]GLY98370.1 AraC family transcriptional regulator [Actinoplanes sp. NBRC 103695]
MPTVWRATDLVPSERAESFVNFVGESVVSYGNPAGMVLGDRDQVRIADTGPLRILRISWTEGRAARGTTQLRRSDPELCKLDVPLSGRFAVEQADRQAALDVNTFTFVDTGRPHRIAAQRLDLAIVMFPRALLPLRDKDVNALAGATFDSTLPGAALITSVVREVARNLDTYNGQRAARIGASVLDLIAATLATRLDRADAVTPESRRRALVLHIRAYIEDNLGNPNLAPPLIAARHHISPRHLHKLFQDEATTVAGLIRARRLARCRKDLLDPAHATKPVSAIAARWGLRDAGYFNRIFQAQYGVPPGEYRRTAALDKHSIHRWLDSPARQPSARQRT